MSTSVGGTQVWVVHGTQPVSTTAQTRGMERRMLSVLVTEFASLYENAISSAVISPQPSWN